MTARAHWKELCMDTTGGEQLGRFWADLLDLEFQPDSEDGNVVGSQEGHGIAMCRVPEAKTVKNRIHWDLYADVKDMVGAGATLLRARDDDPSTGSGQRIGWNGMADPEGNEFCVFDRIGA